MSYNDTPLSTETPAQSQPLMRQNFQQIANSYNTDHIPLTSGSNVGYSNKLTLVEQGSDPGGVNTTDIVYSKATTETQGITTYTRDELFVRGYGFDNAAPAVPIFKTSQITNQALLAASGEGFIPGGLQIRTGTKTGPGTNIPVTYTAFPTATLTAFAISNGNSRTWDTSALGPGGFTANASSALGGGDVFFWLAIGY